MEFDSYVKISQEDIQASELKKSDLRKIVKAKATIAQNVTVDEEGSRLRVTVFGNGGEKYVAYAGDYLIKDKDGNYSVMPKKAFKAEYAKAGE